MGTDQKSIFQLVITGTCDLPPEKFLEMFDPILLEKIGVQFHSSNSRKLSVEVVDYEITEIDDL